MCKCQAQVEDGWWRPVIRSSGFIWSLGRYVEQGVGRAGCRSPKQYSSSALPCPSGFCFCAPAGLCRAYQGLLGPSGTLSYRDHSKTI